MKTNITDYPIQEQRQMAIELLNFAYNSIDNLGFICDELVKDRDVANNQLENQFQKNQFLKSELQKMNSKNGFKKTHFEKTHFEKVSSKKSTAVDKIREFMLSGKRTRKEVVIELLVLSGYNREEVTKNYSKNSYYAFSSTNITKWYGLGTVKNVNGYMVVTPLGKRAKSLYSLSDADQVKILKKRLESVWDGVSDIRYENRVLRSKLNKVNELTEL